MVFPIHFGTNTPRAQKRWGQRGGHPEVQPLKWETSETVNESSGTEKAAGSDSSEPV